MFLKQNTYFHGSKKHFQIFDPNMCFGSKRRAVYGAFWFSDNVKIARSYGYYLYEAQLTINKPYIVDARYENYCEIYLSDLPKDIAEQIDFIDRKRPGDTYNYMKYQRSTNPDFSLRFDTRDLALAAMRADYDTLLVQNVMDAGNKSALNIFGTTCAVFSSEQIRLQKVIDARDVKRRRLVRG